MDEVQATISLINSKYVFGSTYFEETINYFCLYFWEIFRKLNIS